MKVTIEFDFWPPHCYPAKASMDIDGRSFVDLSSFNNAILPLVEEVFDKAKAEYKAVSTAINMAIDRKTGLVTDDH